MPIGTSKVGALGGLVPGGTETFNAPGNFSVPPGVKKVSITGKGGSGNPGNAGNSGNAGNLGTGGAGGAGGTNNPCSPNSGRGSQGGDAHAGVNGDFISTQRTGGNAPPGCNPLQAQPGNPGQGGLSGNSGQAGQAGQAGNIGQSSSGLGNTFPGGAAGNAGATGNAGNGGSGGNGGAGGNTGNNGTGGAGGNGGGSGSNSFSGTHNPRPPSPIPNNVNYGGSGGGGAGATNDGSPAINGTFNVPSGCEIRGGTTSNYNSSLVSYLSNQSSAQQGISLTTPSPGSVGPANQTGGPGGQPSRRNTSPFPQGFSAFQGACSIGNRTPPPFAFKQSELNLRRAGNNPCVQPFSMYQFNANNQPQGQAIRSGAGGGGAPVAGGGGGGGGGRGNAGNAGGAGGAGGTGAAATPQTFNCVTVTPGGTVPITVGSPGGEIVISWNPQ